MKKKLLLIPLALLLAISLVAIGCPTPPPTTPTPSEPQVVTKTVEVEKEYRCLNPQGIQPAVEISALAPRLDTLDGKTIYVNQGEADPVIMPALWERVQKDYPNTNWKLIATSTFGPSAPEQEVLDTADAVIRGVSW